MKRNISCQNQNCFSCVYIFRLLCFSFIWYLVVCVRATHADTHTHTQSIHLTWASQKRSSYSVNGVGGNPRSFSLVTHGSWCPVEFGLFAFERIHVIIYFCFDRCIYISFFQAAILLAAELELPGLVSVHQNRNDVQKCGRGRAALLDFPASLV